MAKYTAAQVGNEIGKSEAWVKRHAQHLPHHRYGRTIQFDDDDLAAIKEMHVVRPTPEPNEPAHDELRPIGRRGRRGSQS